jgi:hypothetical protein
MSKKDGVADKTKAGLKVTGETAQATSGEVTMLFRRVSGCWLVDGRQQ